ncbi:MAG TPA: glycosyl hydrolase [Burkholderiaceae bacterium]
MNMTKFAIALAIGLSQCLLATSALAVQPGDGSNPQPIDGNATQPTRDALSFIGNRTKQTYSNMILGQHLGGPGDLGATGAANDVFDMQRYRIPSAKTAGLATYPRLVGTRYDANATINGKQVYTLDFDHAHQINLRLEALYNTYHPFIAITATPRNPWDPSQGRAPSPLHPASLPALALENRTSPPPANPIKPVDRFWADIDTIAAGLADLRDANGAPIPVLFRPFAEFNTNKYYYVDQDPAAFVALWKQVVKYYEDKGLHNLIYCWEAWTWGSTPSEAALDAWWPGADQVDVVGGAFYFHETGKADYFGLNFPAMKPADSAVFHDLTGIAVANGKPFGAMQWAVDSQAQNGDNVDTLSFMSSLDTLHSTSPQAFQHMAFVYYWTTGAVDEEAYVQANADKLVDDLRVATVSGFDGVQSKQGAIESTSPNRTISATLQTGFAPATCSGCEYRSILSFAAGVIPANAQIDPFGLTVMMSPVTPQASGTPFSVPGQQHCLDAAYGTKPTYFGLTAALGVDDFDAVGVPCVGQSYDWHDNSTTGRAPGIFSAAARIDPMYLNLNGPTQFRAHFKLPLAGSSVVWNGTPVTGINADDPAPQLIFSYTLPN